MQFEQHPQPVGVGLFPFPAGFLTLLMLTGSGVILTGREICKFTDVVFEAAMGAAEGTSRGLGPLTFSAFEDVAIFAVGFTFIGVMESCLFDSSGALPLKLVEVFNWFPCGNVDTFCESRASVLLLLATVVVKGVATVVVRGVVTVVVRGVATVVVRGVATDVVRGVDPVRLLLEHDTA